MRAYSLNRNNAGYSLLELLAYVFILGIIVNLSVSLLLTTKRLTDVGELAFDRIRTVEEIGREFRSAVRASSMVVAELNATQSDGSHLVLAQFGLNGPRYVVFRMSEDGEFLSIEEYAKPDGEFVLEKLKTLALTGTAVRFEYTAAEPAAARTVRLVVDIDNEGTRNTVPAENVFVASLRGWSS